MRFARTPRQPSAQAGTGVTPMASRRRLASVYVSSGRGPRSMASMFLPQVSGVSGAHEVAVGEGVIRHEAQDERRAALSDPPAAHRDPRPRNACHSEWLPLPTPGSPSATPPLMSTPAPDSAGFGDPLLMCSVEGRVGELEDIEHAPVDQRRQVRQIRRRADPLHQALLAHFQQGF